MKPEELIIRCSALGKIMTNPRGSGGGLSATCKGYIEELYLEYEHGIYKTFWSRYTDKGTRVEKDSIRLANEVLDWHLEEDQIIEEKQPYFRNEYIHGHTDVCTDWLLADVKSCWSADTFPWFSDKPKSKDNVLQLQGYMWLTGHDESSLAYCLVNTPEDMILDEIRREHWKQNSYWNGDEDQEIVDFVRAKHDVERMAKRLRVKNFIIKRDEDLINRMKERIEECRNYYAELLEKEN